MRHVDVRMCGGLRDADKKVLLSEEIIIIIISAVFPRQKQHQRRACRAVGEGKESEKNMTQTIFHNSTAWCAFISERVVSLLFRHFYFTAHRWRPLYCTRRWCEAKNEMWFIHEKRNILIRYAEGFFIKETFWLWKFKTLCTTDKGWNVEKHVNNTALVEISCLMLTSILFRFYNLIAQQYINIRNTLISRWFKNH